MGYTDNKVPNTIVCVPFQLYAYAHIAHLAECYIFVELLIPIGIIIAVKIANLKITMLKIAALT